MLIKDILGIFRSNPKKILNYKQISSLLEIHDSSVRKLVNDILRELKANEKVVEVRTGKFKYNMVELMLTGRLEVTRSGAGFLVSEESEDDVYISPENLNRAFNGDTVVVRSFGKAKGKRPEGAVVEIVAEHKREYVGTIELTRDFGFLIADDPKMHVDIYITPEKLKGVKHGEKALVKITDWPTRASSPYGKVIKVLGQPGENNTEMHAILADFGLAIDYPNKPTTAANNLDASITKEEIAKRRDFRAIPTFTIDPDDAKDFDDALSVQLLDNGNWEVGVHIADVSHYVTPGSVIDQEAVKRATSIYLVDRVIPMLPEILSNQICSLRPLEEKLCFSAIFELTEKAELVNEWFGKTVIYSDRRFTYDEAQAILEGNPGDFSKELNLLNDLAKKLREKRLENGSLNIKSVEVKFHLDDEGNPTGVFYKTTKDANRLIEDFMLLANKRTAEFIGKPKDGTTPKTYVYRVHDLPDEEKLKELSQFAYKFGYKVRSSGLGDPKVMNQLLADIEGKDEENIIGQIAIRSMSKAYYSTENIGHYGLAFDYYSHFTSPIRRYPDLIAHRLLETYLTGGKTADKGSIDVLCKHSSTMEKRASEAERASIKFKQVQFMLEKIGEEFDGIISGITDWGMFVEIVENKCEGLIHINNINDNDYYYFDEDNYRLVGKNYGREFRLGDPVTIVVKNADLLNKQLDFELA